MVRRVVDTKFWTSREVVDAYSVEDKFFALYLMTNQNSTQVGIYALPKKVASFETGFTTDVIQVLLDRFSQKYGDIMYSEQTQEVAVLRSLEYSILKGGKPVSDLLERELRAIEDENLILGTYEAMQDFWNASKRQFDQTIRLIFEQELISRKLLEANNENQSQNQNGNENGNDSHSHNHSQNDNDNEESLGTNRILNQDTNRTLKENTNRATNLELILNTDGTNQEELLALEYYINYLKHMKPDYNQILTTSDILTVFYKEILGKVTLDVEEKLKNWSEQLPKSLILEALFRSVDKFKPISYANTIIENWLEEDIKSIDDLTRLDQRFNPLNK